MHVFSQPEKASSLFDAEVLETAVTGEDNDQEADAARIATEVEGNIDALEEDSARQREIITVAHAERGRQVAAVRKAGRARLEDLRSELEGAQHELSVVHSPTLLLPYELMAEILDWHMLMGGRLAATLLVCKWWTKVAHTSPRLWARITLTNLPFRPPHLQGSIVCTDHNYLRLVLSRSRSYPLQLELSFRFDGLPHHICRSTSSFIHGPRAANICTMAIKLILDDQILRRCTTLILANDFLPFDHLNTTVLPLLSSIQHQSGDLQGRELLFVQSLVNLSPALRHIHCNRSLSAKDQGVGLWTKRIESYARIIPSHPCYSLHESPSLRKLEVYSSVVTPLTLPALQILRWRIVFYSSLHLITAQRLHTLILRHGANGHRAEGVSAGPISFPNLRVAIHTWIYDPAHLHMFHTPALEHLSIEYRISNTSPIRFLELFDGWAHMPKPKSLYLDCTFTEAGLITVLSRLQWLEELRIAGTGLRETFWEGLTPSYTSIEQVSSNGNATHILVPKLKVLLVYYPTGMRRITPTCNLRVVVEQDPSNHHPDLDDSRGKDWMVKQASIVAIAREQAGYPLRTLACWSPEQKVVLIGSLDSVPNKPRFVSLTAFWYYQAVLTFTDDRWEDDWSVIA